MTIEKIRAVAGLVGLAFALACAAPRAGAAVNIAWATVGNPNNPAESGGGAVDHTYLIDKYEVTNTQYVEFLNAADPAGANARGLYNPYMGSYPNRTDWTGGITLTGANPVGSRYAVKAGQANLPVIWATWASAARFANWLNNGQGSGSTETGAYDMTQTSPTRLPGATVFLPTLDEWHKAAYYDPTKGGTGGYWAYAMRTDNFPKSQAPPGGSAGANFVDEATGKYALTGSSTRDTTRGYLTDVGAYAAAPSSYGTFDQNGNVAEWSESINFSSHYMLGGDWAETSFPMASNVVGGAAINPSNTIGFRVAAVPEPAGAGTAGVVGGLALLARGRRRLS